MKKLRIGLFVTSLERDYNKTRASYWIRILQMEEFYKMHGAKVSINKYLTRYDAVILFRKPKPKYYFILLYLKIISKKVYFDTCINVFDTHEEINHKRLEVAHKIARTADGFICASHRIAEHSKPHVKSVYVMENPINIHHFATEKKNINFDSPIFGWSGVGAKAAFLNSYADLISGRIVIISEPNIENIKLNFNFEYLPWNYKTFPADLLKIDIALLPRVYNDPYNDSHSSFKALVFAVLGIPIIANKVPSYTKLAGYYDGIVFLEDFNDSIDDCIEELKTRNLNTDRVKAHYSCENQALELINYINSQLKKTG